MDHNTLKLNLEYLLEKYVKDQAIKHMLEDFIDMAKAKHVLREIDRNKSEDYSDSDRQLLKDIYFFYC